MPKFPADIQIEFLKFMTDEVSADTLERWTYEHTQLEKYLTKQDYLSLISLGFKEKNLKEELYKVISQYLDDGELEKRKLQNILRNLTFKNDLFPKSLIAVYNLYCHGYHFLDNIALGYGLTFAIDFDNYSDWEKLPVDEQEERVNKIFSAVKKEVEKVLDWIATEKIILMGEVDEMGYYNFIEKRSEEERKPISYDVSDIND
jgi:hypothetical protein